jgi:hypothetical protein
MGQRAYDIARAHRKRAFVQWTTASRSPERQSPLQNNSLRHGLIIKAAASPITNNDRPSLCGGVLMLAVFLCS